MTLSLLTLHATDPSTNPQVLAVARMIADTKVSDMVRNATYVHTCISLFKILIYIDTRTGYYQPQAPKEEGWALLSGVWSITFNVHRQA